MRGLGQTEAKTGGAWSEFWKNLGQNAVTNLASQVALLKPPTAPTPPTPAAPTPAAPSAVIETAKSIWPILAVASGGLAALVAVIVIKRKGS